jgi:hypothetical protein
MRDIAKRAAKWWSDRLLDSVDLGDEETGFIMDLARSLYPPLSIDDVEKFELILAEDIEEELNKYGKVSFYCDYHPDGVLAKACKQSGIYDIALPLKTGMNISLSRIELKDGYGSNYEVI